MRAIFGTLAGLGLLIGVTPASAQQGGFSGGSSGSSSGGFSGSSSGGFTGSSAGSTSGGFSGSSSGGFSGSSSGGFSGSSSGGFSGSSSGGFTGSSGTSGGFTGTNTGTAGRTTGGAGTTKYGTTSFLGMHFGSPLAMGAGGKTTGSGITGTTGGYTPSNYSNTSNTFGQPVYAVTTTANTATTSRTGALGSTGTMLGGQGTTGALGAAQAFRGATTAGIHRAPQYYAQPVFERMAPRPTLTAMRPDLQDMLSSSTRLVSGGRIQVMTEGERVVLRGSVATERERRIAEAMIRMTPGVREVTNELVAEKTP